MPKICYIPKVFTPDKMALIEFCDKICNAYTIQGYDLTLRQLYYQLVARNAIPEAWWDPQTGPNCERAYNNLGVLVGDARLAGFIDWEHIVDRTRNMEENTHWTKPSEFIDHAAQNYLNDKWLQQSHYMEVWVEKDALKGVIERSCRKLDVPFFSCRGYTSLSEMWAASQRLIKMSELGKTVHIIHLGDHDPSGMDMSRDIKSRLNMFMAPHGVHVLRAALNWPQIQRLRPPPNPAKFTDSRAKDYVAKYGNYSWELDALNPVELTAIITKAVKHYRDEKLWRDAVQHEARGRKTLQMIYDNFPAVVQFLREKNNGTV